MEEEVNPNQNKFAVLITKTLDKKTGQTQLAMQTRGDGISIAEAVIILEGWVNKVKSELQKPFTENIVFSSGDDKKK